MWERLNMLCTSDVHGRLEAVKAFVSAVDPLLLREADVVIVAGDVGNPQDPSSFAEVIDALSKLGKPILYVRGNWDVNALTGAIREDPLAADLESVGPLELKGITLVGHGLDLELYKRQLKRPIVLITHHPPYSILDKGRKVDVDHAGQHNGLPEVNYLVSYYKPVVHIFGHCHALGGIDVRWGPTVYVNAARLDRIGKEGTATGNYALVSVTSDGKVSVKWRFVNGVWKKCSKCGSKVHLPHSWSLCRRCADSFELDFKKIDRKLEKVIIRVRKMPEGIEFINNEVFIPISTLKDEKAFEGFVEYLLIKRLKKLVAEEGARLLILSKDRVVDLYAEGASDGMLRSEFLFSCDERKVGRKLCTLMKLFLLDRGAKVLWKLSWDRKLVLSELVLASEEALKVSGLVEDLAKEDVTLLTYSISGCGGSDSDV